MCVVSHIELELSPGFKDFGFITFVSRVERDLPVYVKVKCGLG